MGSQAKNSLQICACARPNRREERGGVGGKRRRRRGCVSGGRRVFLSSAALGRTFKVNCRSFFFFFFFAVCLTKVCNQKEGVGRWGGWGVTANGRFCQKKKKVDVVS